MPRWQAADGRLALGWCSDCGQGDPCRRRENQFAIPASGGSRRPGSHADGRQTLHAAQIALIQAWIDQGAVWPASVGVKAPELQKHWAFVPPVRSAMPETKNRAWVRNPIDAFVLARLENESLSLLLKPIGRRCCAALSLDLIGPAADARRGRRLPRRQSRPTPTKSRSIACSLRRITASAGAASGWTRRATPIPTAMKRTSRARSGSIATGSSTR